jgi:hypothetical protein
MALKYNKEELERVNSLLREGKTLTAAVEIMTLDPQFNARREAKIRYIEKEIAANPVFRKERAANNNSSEVEKFFNYYFGEGE